MQDTLRQQWEPYESLLPYSTLADKIALPKSLLPETVEYLLPSLQLAQDGPVVHSVFLVSTNYLCEVRLSHDTHDFDVAFLPTIVNYRIQTQQTTKNEPPAVPAEAEPLTTEQQNVPQITYDVATIQLIHSFGTHSDVYYVGPNREAWIRQVLTAVPLRLLAQQ